MASAIPPPHVERVHRQERNRDAEDRGASRAEDGEAKARNAERPPKFERRAKGAALAGHGCSRRVAISESLRAASGSQRSGRRLRSARGIDGVIEAAQPP
jgi:hypothetical protein